MKRKNIFVALCLCAFGYVNAQENQKTESLDTVMIDTKTPIARKNSGKVVVRISSETLAQSTGKTVAQVVNEVSGIEINGSRSNDGQNLGYFVRGGRNRQVVIMVDGVQLNDPSQISNDYDLRLVPASSIESIEIIKGASSVLYGSGAAAAVIQITTKKISKKSISASFTSTLGTNRAADDEDSDIEEFTNYVAINGTLSKFFYDVSFSNRYVEGLSAISAPEGAENFEADVFNQFNGRINLGYHINKNITLSRFFAFDNFSAGFDDFSFTDADNLSRSEQIRTGGTVTWKYNKGTVTVNDSYTSIEREIESSFPSKFDAKSYTFDAYVNHRVNNQLNVVLGVNGNFSSFNSFSIPFGSSDFGQDIDDETATFDIIDPYVNVVYVSDFGFNVSAGVRLNNHSNYGSHIVYNVNPSYGFELGTANLKILASYSTAYITPSLFQLYDASFGNEELEPEENSTIEGGLELTLGSDTRISAVYFTRNEKNFVDFVTVDPDLFIFQYQNIVDEFDASGVEVEVYKKIGKHFNLSANYTNTQADDRFALRIPEHKANASLGYSPNVKTHLGISYQYNGERDDSFFNPTTFEAESVVLESYGLIDLSGSYAISSHVTVFANISNLLDEEYEELYRFQTRGRNVRGGFRLNF